MIFILRPKGPLIGQFWETLKVDFSVGPYFLEALLGTRHSAVLLFWLSVGYFSIKKLWVNLKGIY